jgi:outer membrane beta-barrel protein
MPARRSRPELLIPLLLIFCGAAARAEDVIYGPDGAPTVVQHKLYTMTSRWEVSLLFDAALNTALVDQLGGVLGVSYHPNEWLDVGVEGLFNRTALSSLALNVRADLRARTASSNHCSSPPYPGCKDEFANDNQMRFGGFGVARLSPIYGKFNLASEVKVHFQAFLLGGAGVAGIHRESVNLCNQAGAGTCTDFQSSDATRFTGLVGGGFRFYLAQRFSLTTEVRGYFFSSSYKEANDLTVPSTGNPKNYFAGIATFDAGISILF